MTRTGGADPPCRSFATYIYLGDGNVSRQRERSVLAVLPLHLGGSLGHFCPGGNHDLHTAFRLPVPDLPVDALTEETSSVSLRRRTLPPIPRCSPARTAKHTHPGSTCGKAPDRPGAAVGQPRDGHGPARRAAIRQLEDSHGLAFSFVGPESSGGERPGSQEQGLLGLLGRGASGRMREKDGEGTLKIP